MQGGAICSRNAARSRAGWRNSPLELLHHSLPAKVAFLPPGAVAGVCVHGRSMPLSSRPGLHNAHPVCTPKLATSRQYPSPVWPIRGCEEAGIYPGLLQSIARLGHAGDGEGTVPRMS